jgi:hypothetical protein
MKAWILFALIPTLLVALESEYVVVLSTQNQVKVRQPFEEHWQKASAGMVLKNRETIKSNSSSYARLKSYDGRVFKLAANSQIEARDLKNFDRNELVMELTAIELQRLPKDYEKPKKPEVFILHGALVDSQQTDSTELERYFEFEKNGAMALYSQNFIPGFILKWSRLTSTFPELKNQRLDSALFKSFEKMNMPTRMKKLIEKNEYLKSE